jgi:hypothetical protein
MGAAIIDFRVWPPLIRCQNVMFSVFIDTLMYGFSSTGVTIYCYFGVYYNLYIYFLISYKILIWLPLFSYAWKATKKTKKCMQFYSEDEKEFKFYQIETSEYLNFFIWKKKFHEEPNITICSQVSDTWTRREFFIQIKYI